MIDDLQIHEWGCPTAPAVHESHIWTDDDGTSFLCPGERT